MKKYSIISIFLIFQVALAAGHLPSGTFWHPDSMSFGLSLNNNNFNNELNTGLTQKIWVAPNSEFLISGEWIWIQAKSKSTINSNQQGVNLLADSLNADSLVDTTTSTKVRRDSHQKYAPPVLTTLSWRPELYRQTFMNLSLRNPHLIFKEGVNLVDLAFYKQWSKKENTTTLGLATLMPHGVRELKAHLGYSYSHIALSIEPTWSDENKYLNLGLDLQSPMGWGLGIEYPLSDQQSSKVPISASLSYMHLIQTPMSGSNFEELLAEVRFIPLLRYGGDSVGVGLPQPGLLLEVQAPVIYLEGLNKQLISLVYQGVLQADPNKTFNQDQWADQALFLRWHPKMAFNLSDLAVYPIINLGVFSAETWGAQPRLMWAYPHWGFANLELGFEQGFRDKSFGYHANLSHPLHPDFGNPKSWSGHFFTEGGYQNYQEQYMRAGLGILLGNPAQSINLSGGVDFFDGNRAAYLGLRWQWRFNESFWDAAGLRIYPMAGFVVKGAYRQSVEATLPAYRFWRSELYLNPNQRVSKPVERRYRQKDSDEDGLPDEFDQCPNDAEDFDEYKDEDGCPDLDNDGDGIADGIDLCPTEAEDIDGFEDFEGCPDLDNDKDGIKDLVDKCPFEAEDSDQFEDLDGCPDYDNDLDGILDIHDACPYQAEDFDGEDDQDGCPDYYDKDGIPPELDECPELSEDFDGFEDFDGCPELDNDYDGIPDEKDKCPNTPEIFDGVFDEDGCP